MSLVTDALGMLTRIRDAGHSEVIVAYSGGKDSVATLDLASRVFSKVHAYFLYLVPGLEVEERVLRRAERAYGINIHRLPNPALQDKLRSGEYLPRRTAFRRDLKHDDIYKIMRSRTDARWILFGHRMDESLQRRGMIKSAEGCMWKYQKAYPLWNWNAKSVYGYLQARKIDNWVKTWSPDTSGISLTMQTLTWLKEFWPGDYAKVCEAFPFAEARVIRGELLTAQGKKIT